MTHLASTQRLYYIDWLRVIAMAIVVAVHITMPFQAVEGVWMIQFEQTSLFFSLSSLFFFQWVMHLLFFLAGASAFFSLGSRSRKHYAGARFTRLGVPLVLGLLVLTPIQVYLSWMGMGQFDGSFSVFYAGMYRYCALESNQFWMVYGCLVRHLWFLGFLLVYSLACLPVFLWLRKSKHPSGIKILAQFSQHPAGIMIFIIPIALIQVTLKASFPEHHNWSDFFTWMVYFIFGFVFMMDWRFIDSIARWRLRALGIGIVSFTCIIILLMSNDRATAWELSPVFSWDYALYQVLRSLNSWMWVVFMIATGVAIAKSNSPALEYSNEAVLPVYVLHHVVVIAAAYLLLDWSAPILIKLPVLAAIVLLITLGIYELLIRRFKPLRFLFGMRV